MANALAVPAPSQGGNTRQIPTIPFIRGAVEHAEPFFDSTFTLSASQQNLGPIDVSTYGFLRSILVQVDLVSAGNVAAVAVTEDAPWVAFAELAVQDVNGAPIFGPHSGYECYLHHKYGGFRNQCDPKLLPSTVFSAITTGAVGAAGSGKFIFRINMERGARDGLGALANMNASAAYKVRGTINNLAGIFSVSPTNAPTMRVRMTAECYSQPLPENAARMPQATVPPANGTTGFSSRTLPPTVIGQNTLKHTRVGNFIRNLIYVNRRAGTSRVNGEADLANVALQWFVDSRLLTNYSAEQLRLRMAEWFEFTSVTFEAAGGPDNGVFVLPFCSEFDGKAGYELRDLWLPTTQATRLELLLTLANSGTLVIMTDDVSPAGNIYQ